MNINSLGMGIVVIVFFGMLFAHILRKYRIQYYNVALSNDDTKLVVFRSWFFQEKIVLSIEAENIKYCGKFIDVSGLKSMQNASPNNFKWKHSHYSTREGIVVISNYAECRRIS